MKHLVIMIGLFISIAGCKNNEKNEETEPMTEVEQESLMEENNLPQLEKVCYVYNENGDVIRFEITEIDDNSVKGNLNYAYAEKDKNEGTFEGVLIEDKLIGKYTFMSEGTKSVRDVAFKVEDHQLLEGYGEMNEDGTTFKDTSKLEYPSTFPLKKGKCGS